MMMGFFKKLKYFFYHLRKSGELPNVNKSLELIFIHNPKVAGNSLLEIVGINLETGLSTSHQTPTYLVKKQTWEACFSILAVRHPIDRLISSYNYHTKKSYNGHFLKKYPELHQLIQCENVFEIVLSTNDEKSIEIAENIDPEGQKIIVDKRPEELCLDSTPLMQLINYVPTIIKGDHVLWTHVTTPFVDHSDYDAIIVAYLNAEKKYDSLITVQKLQNFLLDAQGKMLNAHVKDNRWPRTQELEPIFEVNHAVFLNSKANYLKYEDRVGLSPFLYEMDKIKSMDIDWEEDFFIAENIYKSLNAGK